MTVDIPLVRHLAGSPGCRREVLPVNAACGAASISLPDPEREVQEDLIVWLLAPDKSALA
jgi:hypothetical protein